MQRRIGRLAACGGIVDSGQCRNEILEQLLAVFGQRRGQVALDGGVDRKTEIGQGADIGFGAGSGIRFAFGASEYMGTRIAAERLRAERTRLTGASYPGTSRRYEFVVGAQNPRIAGACAMMPATYERARSERPAYPSPAKSGSPSRHSDWWTCMPEPLSPKIGFGMKVADFPAARATLRTTYL